ncbi:MAG: outer membrane lipoprotein LolB [Pseudorhodobacter sp.]|nr:outer membrane lipoprotein LolB [Rhizobacter sp.]
MSRCRALIAATVVCGLSACAAYAPALTAPDNQVLSGRMTLRIDATAAAPARALSAAFELSGNAQQGRLDLNTPLGTTLARARWEPGNVAVSTPQGDSQHDDLSSMTRVLLGEDLPVVALFDWLRGRPWPGAPSMPAELPSADFKQLGWDVSLAEFSQRWVSARRAETPVVWLRVKLDTP